MKRALVDLLGHLDGMIPCYRTDDASPIRDPVGLENSVRCLSWDFV
jgi:hypothetical protein